MGRVEGRIDHTPTTLDAFVSWLAHAPTGTMMDAQAIRATLVPMMETTPSTSKEIADAALDILRTWRERLWVIPGPTRLNVADVAEALGRPKSWVYQHTSAKCPPTDRLPFRKLEGQLVFVADEIRKWIESHEQFDRTDHVALTLVPSRSRGPRPVVGTERG